MERGKQALAQGQGREAAIAYAHAAQIEPDNPNIHLGLAEANLALGLGRTLTWDAQKQQVVGDEEANRLLRRPYRSPWVHPEPSKT